jgi:hypothetical protein
MRKQTQNTREMRCSRREKKKKTKKKTKIYETKKRKIQKCAKRTNRFFPLFPFDYPRRGDYQIIVALLFPSDRRAAPRATPEITLITLITLISAESDARVRQLASTLLVQHIVNTLTHFAAAADASLYPIYHYFFTFPRLWISCSSCGLVLNNYVCIFLYVLKNTIQINVNQHHDIF